MHYEFYDWALGSLGTSDFDAQMSGPKILERDENIRPVYTYYKKLFFEILSGCFHFGLFSSGKVGRIAMGYRKLRHFIGTVLISKMHT